MSAYAAQRAVKAYYPTTPGYGLVTGGPLGKPTNDTNFRTYAIHLARYDAWKFFRLLLSVYTRNKKSLGDPLGSYPMKSRFHILGLVGCCVERKCAAQVDYSSHEKYSAYVECIAAVRQELWSVLRSCDSDRVRRLFCDLLEYKAGPLEQYKKTPPVTYDTVDMAMDTEDASASSASPRLDQHKHKPPRPGNNDGQVIENGDATASSAVLHPDASLEIPRDASLDIDMVDIKEPCAVDASATHGGTPTQADLVGTEAVNKTQAIRWAPGHTQNAGGSSREKSRPADPPRSANTKTVRKSAADRVDEEYGKERQHGMPFTFVARELLEEYVPNEDRQHLLQQIFSTLKQEYEGWTVRHGCLGISNWRLERWAIKLEDAVAKAADDNCPDPETWMPSDFTDKQVYERGAKASL